MSNGFGGYAWAFALVAAATGVGLAGRAALSSPDVAMLYLSAVALVAVRNGRWPSVAAAALAVSAYNFFFVPPHYTFDVAHPSHFLTFAMMFALGLLVSGLTARIRARELAARQGELRAKTEEMRSSLLSAVSHDLRTPLAVITGAATTLRDDAPTLDGPRRAELTDTICQEAERLERLVANLLDMTRLDAGVSIRREWVPLEEIVGAALVRLEGRLAAHPVTTNLTDLPLVSVDPLLLEQLLVNLLENASKHTPSGTPVDIRAAVKQGLLEVEVADRGPGIVPGTEGRVFEKFFRGREPGRAGVGLGLAICRAVAEAHGGRITAANRDGGGALFKLTLPLVGGTPPDALQADPGSLPLPRGT